MTPSDSVLGWVNDDGTYQVNAYKLDNQLSNPVYHPNMVITDIEGIEADGVTTIYFRRNLNEGTQPISNKDQLVIGAYSSFNSDILGYHGATHSDGMISLNFYTGATSVKALPIGLKDIHAIIMFISWGLILQFGILWARYARSLPNSIWFTIHRPTQMLGYLLSLGGIILAYIMVDLHFRVAAHALIGTIIFSLSFFQILVAVFRPHKEEGQPVTTVRFAFEIFHHWNGRILALLAISQIFLGIKAIKYDESHSWLIPFYGAIVGMTLFIILIVEIINCVKPFGNIVPCCPREEKSDDYFDAEFT
jgi:hypothetical protein